MLSLTVAFSCAMIVKDGQEVDDSSWVSIDVTMCAWGSRSQKPTRLEMQHVNRHAVRAHFASKKCVPKRQGKGRPALCKFTSCPHQHLTGLNQGHSGFRTRQAQEYPVDFAKEAVAALLDTRGVL